MYTDPFVPLVIAFIAVIFLAIPVDGIIQGSEKIMENTPKLPDTFGIAFTYVLTIGISYALVWDAKFDFFSYVNLNFTPWVGFLMTAIMVGTGTKVLKSRFDLMSLIPMNVVGGLRSTMLRITDKSSPNQTVQSTIQSSNPYIQTTTQNNYEATGDYTGALEEHYNKV